MSSPALANRASNELRAARAEVRYRLHAGELTLIEAMAEPSVQTMKVADLLESVRGVGAGTASAVLLDARIGYARPIKRLTQRERLALCCALNRRRPSARVGKAQGEHVPYPSRIAEQRYPAAA